MGNDRPFTLEVLHAVIASDLPPNLRHFLMTLATLANSATGAAYYGQDTIAKCMGITDRQVRRNFDALAVLDKRGATTVRVVRKHRGTPDGKGRTSDLWTLVLTGNSPAATESPAPVEAQVTGHERPFETPSTGSPRPVNEPAPTPPLPDVCDSSTGHLKQLNRTSTSGDRRSDRRSDRRRPSKRSESKPETDPRVGKLWAHYHAEHERQRGVPPVFTGQQRGAVGKSWKSMLEALSLDDACSVVTRALTDGFHVQPTAILANLNRYRGKQPTRGKPPVSTQRGVTDEKTAQQWGKDGAARLLGETS